MSEYIFTQPRIDYANKLKMPINEFTKRANRKHNNLYDYSKVIYINARTKVIIICPIHGEFEQDPYSHLKGHGCSKCAFELVSNGRKSNTKEFINRANIIHNFKYDYSKTIYTFALEKLTIICPIHGEFYQTPDNHLHGKGCHGVFLFVMFYILSSNLAVSTRICKQTLRWLHIHHQLIEHPQTRH